MLFIDCFNHNVYLESKLVGYVGTNEIFINGKKFADFSDEGTFSISGNGVGYIDDDGTIFLNGREAGYVDAGNNLVFYKL